MSTRTTLHEQITHAHIVGREAFEVGLTLARQAEDEAATTDDAVSAARALALQGKLLLAHGLMEDACTLATRVDPLMREGMVFVPFCYAEAPANRLTNPALDPVGKIPEFKYAACRVEPGRCDGMV